MCCIFLIFLLTDNLCYHSFKHLIMCFIFLIFYLATIVATIHLNTLSCGTYFWYFTYWQWQSLLLLISISCVPYFWYFTCRQSLLTFTLTFYQAFHIFDILLANNLCYCSFWHPIICLIFLIFYLPTISASIILISHHVKIPISRHLVFPGWHPRASLHSFWGGGLAFQKTVGQDKQMVEAWRGRGGSPLTTVSVRRGGGGGLSPHTLEISP